MKNILKQANEIINNIPTGYGVYQFSWCTAVKDEMENKWLKIFPFYTNED